jgi:segregation and condensation protein B
MNELNLQSKIESLLFYKGEPMSLANIAKVLSVSVNEVEQSIKDLSESKKGTGLCIVNMGDQYELCTSPDASVFLEALRKEELTKELSKATLDTLSIILYKNNVTRSEIDYIRGVNSSFILRNLLIRGLIEKGVDPSDSRRVVYKPTIDTLRFMGVDNIQDLPRYNEVVNEIQKALNNQNTNE